MISRLEVVREERALVLSKNSTFYKDYLKNAEDDPKTEYLGQEQTLGSTRGLLEWLVISEVECSGENTEPPVAVEGWLGEEVAPGDTITDRLHSFLGRPEVYKTQNTNRKTKKQKKN